VNGAHVARPATGALRKEAALKTVHLANYKLNLALKTLAHVGCLRLKLTMAVLYIHFFSTKLKSYCCNNF
jgi:hypothetical protein